ncbi:kinase-like domain-containing protein [Dactylonectria macrodidyma]|uniref:non-specific serine/threonine protein kinase n=1 Tax=Dactylonectria macrodidyma TaxID=307937 RepID=A0A9P9DT08_9HYPO|nr:kinase-like domain-containing protein [Dactylonectria macrodidyma]
MPSHTARDGIVPPLIAETPDLVILNQKNYENQRVPDFVRDSRMMTRFLPSGATEHTVYRVSHQSPHLRPCRINEMWYRRRELGNGSFGCVWLEKCASGPAEGKLRAVKEIRKDPSLPVPYLRELEAMAKFSHERYVHCFVECYGWYESENMVFIAMEYIKYGDLQNYLHQPFPEPRAKVIASQLVEGLGYMHENGFAHRDLKPKNILVYQPGPDWWVKIGDLGISKRAEQGVTAFRTGIGTEGYVAPEVIGFVPDKSSSSSSDAFSYTPAVDMWALGELLFRIIAKRPVFPNRLDLFNHVVNKHPFPVPALKATGASQDCCNFVTECMAVYPKCRLKASEAAAHPWVQTSRPPSLSGGRSSTTRSVAVATTNLGLEDR